VLNLLQGNHCDCKACIKLILLLLHLADTSGQQLDGLFFDLFEHNHFADRTGRPKQQLVLLGG
jgi:hypothetical protein